MSEWISVDDELPKSGQRVLVYVKNGVYTEYEIDIEYIEPTLSGPDWVDQGVYSSISHWMPLPKPPETE